MALPNGDLITTVFDPQMAYPVDKRMQVDTLNSRDSISMYIRWEGMTVYVLENSKIYILQGGRSNEYWKELGTGTGTGGTTFVGQFESADLLPTSGRSAGDYAFVGTGDDFVQYNWDNIANEWVIQAETNLSAFDFYQNGQKTIYVKGPKDIIITDEGNIIAYPEFMGNLVFTKPFNLRGVVDALGDKEFTIENSSGEPGTIEANYVGGPANSAFNIPETITIQNGEKLTFKSEDGEWVLSQNTGEVAFSDRLDSVGAIRTIGPDGLEVITGVFDKNTGKEVSFKEYEDTPAIVDGTIFIQLNGTYFADSEFLSSRKISAKRLGVTTLNSPGTNRANLSTAIRLCANLRATLQITEDIEIDGEILITGDDSGVTIEGVGGAEIKRSSVSANPAARGTIFFIDSDVDGVTAVPTDITFSGLILDGNRENIDTSNGTGIHVYASEITDPLNINIFNVRIKNMKSNGITVTGKGVTINNAIIHNCGVHGISTEPGSDHVTINNVISYDNIGRGLNISSGTAIVNNLWAFRNIEGGMKVSGGLSEINKFVGDNLILENNEGVGLDQSGDGDPIIQIGTIICRNNGRMGLAITSGKVRSIASAVLINNNTSGGNTQDNVLFDCQVGNLYIEQEISVPGNVLYTLGKTQISNLVYKNCDGVIRPANSSYLGIFGGVVQNTNGYFINRTNNDNVTIDLHNIKFVDTTPGNTQATAIRIVNNNTASIVNCDFRQNPGPKVNIHQGSDVLVKDCRGFDHSAVITNNVNYSFFKGDRHRYLRFTGNANTITVNADIFEAGDEIKGEIQGGTKTITAGAGVTLRGANMKVAQGERFSIKFESPTNALVTVYISSLKAKLTVANTDLNELREFFEYSLAANPFLNAPNDTDTWYVRSIKGDSNTIYLQTAWSRTGTGDYYTRVYISGAWTTWKKAVPDATTTIKGIIEIATPEEVNTGTDAVRAVTPETLQGKLDGLILSATPTLNFGSISAGSAEILTATVTGASLGDNVVVAAPISVYTSNNCTVDGWVSDVDEVSVRIINNGGSGVDPDEGVFKIKVFK